MTCLNSGGPLVVYNKNRWILIGLVSFVPGVVSEDNTSVSLQCNPSDPSFHTKVSSYIKWINLNL